MEFAGLEISSATTGGSLVVGRADDEAAQQRLVVMRRRLFLVPGRSHYDNSADCKEGYYSFVRL